MAERGLAAGAATRPHPDRHVIIVHLGAEADGNSAHVHLGQALPDAVRRHLGVDAGVIP